MMLRVVRTGIFVKSDSTSKDARVPSILVAQIMPRNSPVEFIGIWLQVMAVGAYLEP